MKVCPKCHSTFTDETLSFCLTDGTPLVHSELGPEFVSNEFSNANTIFDSESKLFRSVSHSTDPQSYGQPTQFLTSHAPGMTIDRPAPRNRLMYLLIAVLALGLVSVGAWVFLKDNFRNIYDPPREVIKSAEAKKTLSPLTPDQSAQIQKEVTDFLFGWKNSIEKRDLNEQMRFYAKTLEIFYRDNGKDQNHVRAERQKAIERFTTLSLDINNVIVTPESERFATVVFDKTWAFSGKERFSSGSVQQEMGLVKSDGRWFIVIEKDLQIYNINNRQANNNTNANIGNNTPANQ